MIRRRPASGGGRHRDGMAPALVPRRTWDHRARGEAERLDREWKDWTVFYGAHSRLFYAIAAWPVPGPVILQGATADDLEAQMYGIVMALAVRPEVEGSGTSPGRARRRSRDRRADDSRERERWCEPSGIARGAGGDRDS
ncbi:hypothetical protein ABT352_00755 [Streptosporangium sp. NPDC000563]|uniref:hypothetical protein n=1 Tax=Streptosporangium sp. NPDC000563 TaxID=3154366 RepID=UPI0033186E33